jgi:hypothetical protein
LTVAGGGADFDLLAVLAKVEKQRGIRCRLNLRVLIHIAAL